MKGLKNKPPHSHVSMYISTSRIRGNRYNKQKNLILFNGVDGGFLRHVDTIQELSDILVLGSNTLIDKSSRVGDELDVISLHNYLVLLSGLFADDSVSHLDDTDVPFSKVVADFHGFAAVDDV